MARTGSRSGRQKLTLRVGATVVAAAASLGLLAACSSSSSSGSGASSGSTSTACARPSNFPSGFRPSGGTRPTNFPSGGTRPTAFPSGRSSGAFGHRPSGCAGFGGAGGGSTSSG